MRNRKIDRSYHKVSPDPFSPPKKGSITTIENGSISYVFKFIFNPTERSMNRIANYTIANAPGAPAPQMWFSNIGETSIGLRFLLDDEKLDKEKHDGIRNHKAFFESLVTPEMDSFLSGIPTYVPPPQIRYTMGNESFPILVLGCSMQDVKFNKDGVEIRTWVDLDIRADYSDPSVLRARIERLRNLRERVVITDGNL